MKRNTFCRISGIYFLLLLLLCTACKKDFEKPQWDTNILAPFVYTELGINNIVKSGTTQTNADHSVDLFVRDTLYTLQMDSLVSIVTPTFDINRTLDSIKFDTAPIVTKITLGQIARQMQQNPSTAAMGTFILSNQGNTAPFIPAINGITGGPIPINISNVLQTAEIKTGFLDITIDNGLPLDITHAEFQITNANPPAAVIAQPVMNNIAKGTSQTDSEDISGKHVEGNLNANIVDMDFASAFGVKIDTNNAVTITLKVRNVTVSSATAIFPAQNVINDASVNYLLNMGTVKLKQIKIASGTVKIEVGSSLPDSLFFTYSIPGAVKNGVPFQVETVVPPQAGGSVVFTYDMAGYVMSLRGDPAANTDYNGIYNTLVGRIKYTGRLVSLSLNDFVHVKIGLDQVNPSYVNGYLGDTTINIVNSSTLSLFNKMKGTLAFDHADVAIVVDNSFGVPGSATINNITVHNGSNSASASSSTVALGKGIDGNPPVVTSTSIPISNATALVNVMPKTLDYNGVLQINPSGTFDDNQFAYAAYPVKVYSEFKMPLALTANQLQLTDTIPLSSSPQLNGALKKGKLNLIVDNGFPLSAQVKAIFLDAMYQPIDSLANTDVVASAPKDSDGKATESKRTIISYALSSALIGNIKNAKFVLFNATFDTGGTHSKIYSDNRIKFKLAGDVQYTVNAQ